MWRFGARICALICLCAMEGRGAVTPELVDEVESRIKGYADKEFEWTIKDRNSLALDPRDIESSLAAIINRNRSDKALVQACIGLAQGRKVIANEALERAIIDYVKELARDHAAADDPWVFSSMDTALKYLHARGALSKIENPREVLFHENGRVQERMVYVLWKERSDWALNLLEEYLRVGEERRRASARLLADLRLLPGMSLSDLRKVIGESQSGRTLEGGGLERSGKSAVRGEGRVSEDATGSKRRLGNSVLWLGGAIVLVGASMIGAIWGVRRKQPPRSSSSTSGSG